MSDIQAPVDPKSTVGYRVAKWLVIVLSALIILALIALVTGFVLKMMGKSTKVFGSDTTVTAPAGANGAFVLPPGARILKTETQPGRLILHVTSNDGDEIDIVSTEDGRLISRIKSPPPPVPAR